MKFKVGNRVTCKRDSMYYSQSMGCEGIVTKIRSPIHSHQLWVRWKNGHYNCYRECDLLFKSVDMENK